MNEPSPEISKSALVYLEQAAVEISKEQNFQPANRAELMAWLNDNTAIVSQRASKLQQDFIAKVLAEKKTIFPALSAVVWGAINKDKIDRDVNRYIQGVIHPDNNC
jgi:hypothetical protein